MTALPRRNPAVADGGLPGTLHPGLRSQGLPCIPHRCFPKAHQELCPCSDLLPPPKEGGHIQSGKLLLEHLGVFSLPSFSRPEAHSFPLPPIFFSEVSWGKKQMGFSRKAAECLLHLPSPPPLPLRTKHCSCHGNCAGPTCCFLQATGTALEQYQGGWSDFGSCSLDAMGHIGICFMDLEMPTWC